MALPRLSRRYGAVQSYDQTLCRNPGLSAVAMHRRQRRNTRRRRRRRKPAAGCRPIPAKATTIGREIRGRRSARRPSARSRPVLLSRAIKLGAEGSGCFLLSVPFAVPTNNTSPKTSTELAAASWGKTGKLFMSNRQRMSASCGPGFDRRMPGRDRVVPLHRGTARRSVGHAVGVQAEDFVAIGDHVDAIAVDGRRRADPQSHGVEIAAFPARGQARNHEPPEEPAGRLVQAKQDAAARLLETRIREACCRWCR